MNQILTAIEDMVSSLFSLKPTSDVTRNTIYEAVRKTAIIMSSTNDIKVTDEDINLITKKLEERFFITMSLGILFAEQYKPWLDAAKGDIQWFYWDRYREIPNQGRISFASDTKS